MSARFSGGGFVTVTLDSGEVLRARLVSLDVHRDAMSFTDTYGHERNATRGPTRFNIQAIAPIEDEIRPPLPSPTFSPMVPAEEPEPVHEESPVWGAYA